MKLIADSVTCRGERCARRRSAAVCSTCRADAPPARTTRLRGLLTSKRLGTFWRMTSHALARSAAFQHISDFQFSSCGLVLELGNARKRPVSPSQMRS